MLILHYHDGETVPQTAAGIGSAHPQPFQTYCLSLHIVRRVFRRQEYCRYAFHSVFRCTERFRIRPLYG